MPKHAASGLSVGCCTSGVGMRLQGQGDRPPYNSNITKVNRTKHKKSRDTLGKRIAHSPPLFSSLKEAALSNL